MKRRLTLGAALAALALPIAFPGAASAKPRLRFSYASYIAQLVVQERQNADTTGSTSGAVEWCQRRGRLKVRCFSAVRVFGDSTTQADDLRCEWYTNVFGTDRGRPYYRLTPEVCAPAPPL